MNTNEDKDAAPVAVTPVEVQTEIPASAYQPLPAIDASCSAVEAPKVCAVKKEKRIVSPKGVALGKPKRVFKRAKPVPGKVHEEFLTEVLTLLLTVRDANPRKWLDLTNADPSGAMAKLNTKLKKLRFYRWQQIGASWYYITGHLTGKDATAVAYVLPEGRGFRWTVETSRKLSGVETSLAKAREIVESYREYFAV